MNWLGDINYSKNFVKTALVLGSSGFIGGHLVKRLKADGYWVRGVDLVEPKYNQPNEFLQYDLRDRRNVDAVVRLDYEGNYLRQFTFLKPPFTEQRHFDEVYQLAADMGGAGYIFTGEHDADVMHNSATINLNVAEALKNTKTKVFYSSSACMYPREIQNDYHNVSLSESDAYPANPDSEYGWEKLFSERLFLAYQRNYNLNVRIARFHNIYGPEGTYKGGKEKAPAAMCRKVVESDGAIEVWGTGEQTRSFLYIEDCIDAVRLLMESEFKEPINIGSEEMVTINQLAKLAIQLSGKNITINNIPGPVGVMGRNSDNGLIEKVLSWKPKYTLRDGMEKTFNWIKSQYDGNI